jgi:two-component system chemotaxis sensor kinase CheA
MEDLDDIVSEFLVESLENLDQLDRDLVALEQEPDSRALLASIFRTIHTIKGTSGFLAFSRLEELTHVGENLLARLRDGQMRMGPAAANALLNMVDTVRALLASIEVSGSEGDVDVLGAVAAVRQVLEGDAGSAAEPAAAQPVEPPVAERLAQPTAGARPALVEESVAEAPQAMPAEPRAAALSPSEDTTSRRSVAESSIRVDVDLLDSLMRLVGELVLTRNQVVRQSSLNGNMDLLRASQRLNLIATELQEGVMKTRMQPIDQLWSKLPRVVRDLGVQCGKNVTLEMFGRETELDRTLLEAVKDPLTHLVRNSVDHGIEPPGTRIANGKPAQGKLTLRSFHEGGQVVVEVSDDGAGIDPAKVGASAVAKGLITAEQLAAMSPADALQLIFRPGFSTAAHITNVSGRGVGMDVVKTNIDSIGGTIEVESECGLGTTCRLRIPLTLAIVPALTVDCEQETYAIPQVNLLELVALSSASAQLIETVGGVEVYRLRGQLLPLVRLRKLMHQPGSAVDSDGVIAVLQSEGRRFGLVVDRVVNTEEIVVKPLSRLIKGIGVFSGATILGDGRVALILDVQCIARTALKAEAAERMSLADKGDDLQAGDEERMLVVSIGPGRQVGIPLETVTRLEVVRVAEIEHVGHREVIRRKSEILPLIRLDQLLGGYGSEDGESLPIIVYTSEGRSVAMAVQEILDIVDASTAAQSDLEDSGVLGAVIIKDRVTELLDVRSAILAADPRFFAGTLELGHAESDSRYAPALA